MNVGTYTEGDNVEVYVDGSFRGHGNIVEASISVVRVRFRDQDGKIKTFDRQIGNSVSKNFDSGNWEIRVPSSAIHDVS
jgi:hypothetical protein